MSQFKWRVGAYPVRKSSSNRPRRKPERVVVARRLQGIDFSEQTPESGLATDFGSTQSGFAIYDDPTVYFEPSSSRLVPSDTQLRTHHHLYRNNKDDSHDQWEDDVVDLAIVKESNNPVNLLAGIVAAPRTLKICLSLTSHILT